MARSWRWDRSKICFWVLGIWTTTSGIGVPFFLNIREMAITLKFNWERATLVSEVGMFSETPLRTICRAFSSDGWKVWKGIFVVVRCFVIPR